MHLPIPEQLVLLRSVLAVISLLALPGADPTGSARALRTRSPSSDSAATMMIIEELRATYRDIDDRNWTSLLTHFWPAKVTARFAAPTDSSAWRRLAAPPPIAPSAPDHRCAPRATVALFGSWSRVLARRCDEPVIEAWLYLMGGHWKIVHLVQAQPQTIP